MIKSRVARPTRDLERSSEFYRTVLGLTITGSFHDHDGYDGMFLALPGGGEVELTAGPVEPTTWTDDDLLVLYVADRAALDEWAQRLAAHAVSTVDAANPYWNRFGHTVLDPDGYRVVIALADPTHDAAITVDRYDGDRAELRGLFELAEDSAEQLARYAELGTVLVARRDNNIVGHLQLVPTGTVGEIELKNMAVLGGLQRAGIGRTLVAEAVRRSADSGFDRMVVATATADIGNIRFYQRVGFRMRRVELDAFTPETGYPDPLLIDGIELRDRVWFDRTLRPATG